MALENAFGERTINEFVLMFKNRQINLEPWISAKLRLEHRRPATADPVDRGALSTSERFLIPA